MNTIADIRNEHQKYMGECNPFRGEVTKEIEPMMTLEDLVRCHHMFYYAMTSINEVKLWLLWMSYRPDIKGADLEDVYDLILRRYAFRLKGAFSMCRNDARVISMEKYIPQMAEKIGRGDLSSRLTNLGFDPLMGHPINISGQY